MIVSADGGSWGGPAHPRKLRSRHRHVELGALLRLARAVLVEAHDEWQVSDRPYKSEGSMATLTTNAATTRVAQPELVPA
jgi:hypothetical protein